MEKTLFTITIYQMIIFIEIVEQNGFSKAGQILHLTQPAITKNIAKMEKELGLKLFERSTRKFQLTEAGELLYKEWKGQIMRMQNSYNKALEIAYKDSNRLNIAVTSTTRPSTYFWDIQKRFQDQYPNVELNIESDSMDTLCEELILEQYDIIFVPDFEHYTLDESKMPWKWAAKSNYIVVVPAGHRFWEKECLTIEQIKEETFIALNPGTRPNYHHNLNELFASYGYKPKIGKIYNNAYSLRMVYDPQDGVLLVDKYIDLTEITGVKFIPLLHHYNGIICSWNPNRKSPYVQKFVDMI